MTLNRLIGSAPNQVSVNGMLGNLAFQNAESVNLGSVVVQEILVNNDKIRVATAKTPASATATGTTGDICWDASYIYVCTATNTWKRSALSTW